MPEVRTRGSRKGILDAVIPTLTSAMLTGLTMKMGASLATGVSIGVAIGMGLGFLVVGEPKGAIESGLRNIPVTHAIRKPFFPMTVLRTGSGIP